jgi:hypothetical protein
LSKLPESLSLPKGRNEWEERLLRVLGDHLRKVSEQVNSLAVGRIGANYNALSAAPTSGLFAIGDFVKRVDPEVSGSALQVGWVCVQEGSASASSFRAVSYSC